MPLLRRNLARWLPCALAALLAMPLPAAAQWIAVGRWGTEQSFRFVPPGTWMVEQDSRRTLISAEGDHHDGRLTLTCPEGPGTIRLSFSHYYGTAMNLAAVHMAGMTRVPATLAVGDQSFVVHLDQSPDAREWNATLTTPEVLDAIGQGRHLDLRTMDGQRVTRFGLARASAAREALRQGCGL